MIGRRLAHYEILVGGELSSSLFARPVSGGPERQILDSMTGGVHAYFPVDGAVYYIPTPEAGTPFAREVRILDLATGHHQTLARFEARAAFGLTVSPDRKTVLWSVIPTSPGDDLMLIRNFR